jgi:hypothetical protein
MFASAKYKVLGIYDNKKLVSLFAFCISFYIFDQIQKAGWPPPYYR